MWKLASSLIHGYGLTGIEVSTPSVGMLLPLLNDRLGGWVRPCEARRWSRGKEMEPTPGPSTRGRENESSLIWLAIVLV